MINVWGTLIPSTRQSRLPAGTAGELRNPPLKLHALGIANGSNRCIAACQAENLSILGSMTASERAGK